jgi:hypothetical protein
LGTPEAGSAQWSCWDQSDENGPAEAGPFDGGLNGKYLNLNRPVLPEPPRDRLALCRLSHYTAADFGPKKNPAKGPPGGVFGAGGPRIGV